MVFPLSNKKQTGVVPPDFVDVIMVAPKGSGTSVRRNFLDGSGINSSFAVFQDFTGRALDRTLALGIAIGSGFLFPTTFQMEVYSDLTGERGVLMGALAGIMEAQYNELRKHGHTPSEAFNETVEELTQSLIRLVAETAWIGCMPIVPRPLSAELWIGATNSVKQSRLCFPNFINRLPPEKKRRLY